MRRWIQCFRSPSHSEIATTREMPPSPKQATNDLEVQGSLDFDSRETTQSPLERASAQQSRAMIQENRILRETPSDHRCYQIAGPTRILPPADQKDLDLQAKQAPARD